MKKKCEVEGCDRDHYAKGLCSKHWQKLRSGGDPHIPSWKDLPFAERFKAKLGPKDPVTGCIEWEGDRHPRGYGLISKGGKTAKAHRLVWELKRGPIPPGMCVCHSCDNPPCCNEEHLYLGTHADNMADKMAKGRNVAFKGAKNGNSKLTEADVLEIRRRLAAGELLRVLAATFGITTTQVSSIKLGKSWRHLNSNNEK